MHAVAVLIVGACFVYLLSVFAALGVMLVPSVLEHRSQIRAGLAHDDETLSRSRFTIPVSVIAPAFDEEPAIEASVRSLLALDYPDFEVIVINDGSRDATLGVLTRAFALEPLTMFYRRRFDTATVRGVYRSLTEPRLTVVDKENGGKADALNVGLNLAQNRYICTVDSDTVYSRQALLHSMRRGHEQHHDRRAPGAAVRSGRSARRPQHADPMAAARLPAHVHEQPARMDIR